MNQENPYATPKSDVEKEDELSDEESKRLESLAKGQKVVIYAVLIYFLAIGLTFVVPTFSLILSVVSLIMSIVGLIMVLSVLPVHLIFKIIYFILLFVPGINLLALLSINSHATMALKEAGYKVGLLGAKK